MQELTFTSDEEEMLFWLKAENSDQVYTGGDPITDAKPDLNNGKIDLVHLGSEGYYDCTAYKLKPEHAEHTERVRALTKRIYRIFQ
ncbi:MAG TPA: hypothetical protein VN665_00940 [Candidatus Paceibacterota bacterium]|nr:hypothetical protein [Candidatus Paceibacterota bacterium]